jgi:hypothetical protein
MCIKINKVGKQEEVIHNLGIGLKTLANFKRDMLTEQIPIKYCGSCDLYLASLDQLKTIICCTRLGHLCPSNGHIDLIYLEIKLKCKDF